MPHRIPSFRASALVWGLALGLLGGCGTTGLYYAEGVSAAARDVDLAQCQAAALRAFPYLAETRYTERRFVPPTETCTEDGTCTRTRGYFEGGEPYTVDANEDLRRADANACMIQRGYSRVSLPICAAGTAVAASTAMAPLGPDTCILRSRGAPDRVVNPA